MIKRPVSNKNPELTKKYAMNIHSVIKEVWASDSERVDLVTFINGIPFATIELKYKLSSQSYLDAINQYKNDRNADPANGTRLFRFRTGALVHFAMDDTVCYMTTKLDGKNTIFLPFNKGRGEGIEAGAGNPITYKKYATEYLWENVLTPDSVVDIISKYMMYEIANKKVNNIIFPRYHQWDCVESICKDILKANSSNNYLINHSAGSGKSLTIAWIAEHLSSLHRKDDKNVYNPIYKSIIIITDRIVCDRQNQNTIKRLEGQQIKKNLIKYIDDSCTSADLANAINGNCKIICSTIQKFPYIADEVEKIVKNQDESSNFAIIIDEAHSSTSGKDIQAVNQTFGNGSSDISDGIDEEAVLNRVEASGLKSSVSVFAFTATPKEKTLQMFGRKDGDKYVAFHTYSMKQAIEEKFILNVLKNYITYDTYCDLMKIVDDDPLYNPKDARREIQKVISGDKGIMIQRIKACLDIQMNKVIPQVGGHGKGMMITDSIEQAIAYYFCVNELVNADDHYKKIKPLIAFSGKGTYEGKEYTEEGINRCPEHQLPKKFREEDFNLLIVANKYQTGYDEPLLCAEYIFKKIHGASGVQTITRTDRPCYEYKGKVPITIDFVNSEEEVAAAFAPYYTGTTLTSTKKPEDILELCKKLEEFDIIDSDELDRYYKAYKKGNIGDNEYNKIERNTLSIAENRFNFKSIKEKNEIKTVVKQLSKQYAFYSTFTVFGEGIVKKAIFAQNFIKYLTPIDNEDKVLGEGDVEDIREEVNVAGYSIKQASDHITLDASSAIISSSGSPISSCESTLKRLSQIIDEINSDNACCSFESNSISQAVSDLVQKNINDPGLIQAAISNDNIDSFKTAFKDHFDVWLCSEFTKGCTDASLKPFWVYLAGHDDVRNECISILAKDVQGQCLANARTSA
jgi:type I restriction enzyme R subunit